MCKPLLCVACAALGLGSYGYGSLIDIALGNTDATPTGAAVVGNSSDQWNEIDGNGATGPLALFDSAGAATSATLSFTADGAVPALNPPLQPLPALMHYYIFNNTGGDVTVDLEGLGANQAYHVVLYLASDDGQIADREAVGTVEGASTVSFGATGDPQPSFVDGSNYVELDAVSDSLGSLKIVESDGPDNFSGEVDLNGIQLQATPEPATMLALGLGLAGIRARRKARIR